MLEFLFSPLTLLPPVVSILIFSVFVTFLINIFYKIMINQNEAKSVKDRINEISKQMKAEQKKGNSEKASSLLKEMMSENSKIMRMTMKPMMISLIIVIIVLPTMPSFYGDKLVDLKDNKGTVKINGAEYQVQLDGNKVSIGSEECNAPCEISLNSRQEVSMEAGKVKIAPIVAFLPIPLPFAGSNLGWLGWYFIVSIPTMLLIRKFMKIYV